MTYDNYREIPLKIFIKVLNDEDKLSELLPSVDPKTWKGFKEDFEAENPTPEVEVKIEKQQEVLSPDSELKMYSMLVQICLIAPESWEKFFDACDVKKKKTLLESIEYVNGLVAKKQVRLNIATAEFKKFLADMPEKEEQEGNIFDVISSLSAVTGNRLEYNTSTIGELLAEQRLAQKMNKKNG